MDDYGEGASFNMSVQTLIRMDMLLRECNHFSYHKQLTDWYDKLKILSREVLSVTTNNHTKDRGDEERIQTLRTATIKEINTYKLMKQHKQLRITKLLNLLEEWDFEIRKVMSRRNLLMAGKQDARYAIGGIT